MPSVRAPAVRARIGIDAHPLDACSDRDANWLHALASGPANTIGALGSKPLRIAAFRCGSRRNSSAVM